MDKRIDTITPTDAVSLPGLFYKRVQRSKDAVAYRYFDADKEKWLDLTWGEMAAEVARWKEALKRENLAYGDRVGLMLRNCQHWVMYEQAALALGLVIVPLYTNDRADNIAYIAQHADLKVILFDTEEQWLALKESLDQFGNVKRFVSIHYIKDPSEPRLKPRSEWLPESAPPLEQPTIDKQALASIVYTSGTTGRPKGVMLSHNNILSNAYACSQCEAFYTSDQFLSFLPLSHMFERTAGYYMPMLVGATVNYARAVDKLAEDLQTIHPTVLVTVPRIFERVRNKIKDQLEHKSPIARKLFNMAVETGWLRYQIKQKKASWHPRVLLWPLLNVLVAKKIMGKLGGRMRLAVSGGAPLTFEIAQMFIGLGLNISQGYGMTESSPVVCTNRLADNEPASVGQVLPGVQVKLGERNELLVKGDNVMLGYWQNEEATKETIDADGWLHTGDVARIDGEHIYITGRIKEIIVLANGEKVPPSDIEMAIGNDSLFEQAMVIGEGKPYLSALLVLNREHWNELAAELAVNANDTAVLNSEKVTSAVVSRIAAQLSNFPGYAKIPRVYCMLSPWTIEEGLITPKMSLKRNKILEKYAAQVEELYAGH
ncbi:MAG: long-chain fatty acid--CoA ligase [Gammaproteobacteria bacterium]|nr:long-chain fatty acid--CoA ligase [Gammaproteobacteria bacterium]MDH5652692.1 long-chain fatty acid--CoA ligase [Gammaproteobacteria bacterium]